MKTTIGTVWTPEGRQPVTVEKNAGGTVTVSGPGVMRDYRYLTAAVRFAKKVYADESNRAEWKV